MAESAEVVGDSTEERLQNLVSIGNRTKAQTTLLRC